LRHARAMRIRGGAGRTARHLAQRPK
jgi:hypothetical protein